MERIAPEITGLNGPVWTPREAEACERYRITGWQDLLAVAEAAHPYNFLLGKDHGYLTYATPDGWSASIFYDCTVIDCIGDFLAPDGSAIDFWAWGESHPWRPWLMAWGGPGALEAMLQERTRQPLDWTPSEIFVGAFADRLH